MNMSDLIQKICIYAIPVIFAITVHEAAHGWVAMLLGDMTAKREGRVTLNPLPHIDPIGTVAMPLLGLALGGFLFGWAKPVNVELSNLRYGRKSFVWVALAGPASNMLMAIFWALVARAAMANMSNAYVAEPLALMGMAGVKINMMLMIFNLLPIPPLDGSRVVARFLKGRALDFWLRMERHGMIILLVLMLVPGVFSLWFDPMSRLFSWIPAIAG